MTTRAAAACEFLEWDTAFFGRRIGRLFAADLTPDDMRAVQAWRREHAVECIYCLVKAPDHRMMQTLEQDGFQLVDLRLTLLYTAQANSPDSSSLPNGLSLRAAELSDLPALRSLAASSHHATRFFRDSHFAPERSQALYATWIEKSCRGEADVVLVAIVDEQLAGYCTGHVHPGGQASLGLCAVSVQAQRRGVGQALVRATLRELGDRGAQRISVVTQGSNLAAYNLYRRCGFVTEDLELWYHGWFNDQ